MGESRESTILDVKLDAGKVAQDLQDLITRIAALKAQQKSLNEEIKAGNDVDGKYAEQLIRVKDQLAWTEKQAKGLSATTKLLNADTLTYSDSLNGERQKLADMQKAYDQLDRAQRESEGGKAFLEAIKAQSDAVKGLEEDTGRAQRNVGNYPKAWGDAIPGLNKATGVLSKMGITMDDLKSKGVKAFSGLGQSIKAFGKAFITPPIVIITAVLGAIMAIVNKVSAAFKKNDDAMTALQKAFAIFKPIGEAIGAVFNAIANAIAKVVEGAAKAVSWIVGKLAPGYKKAADEAQALVQAQDDLEEAERKYTENSAKRNRDISALRAEAMDKEKHTAAERKELLAQAIELEKANLEEEKKIKAEQLRILEETARRERDTSDETKDKIAQARAAMYQAEQSYYDGVRSLQKQMANFDKEIESEKAKAAEDARKKREAAAKAAADAERARQENARKIAQEAEDFAISLIEDETARTIAQRKIQGEREIAALQERLDKEKNLTEESRAQLAELIKGKQAALDAELEQMATDAANALTEEQVKAEEERAMRILEYKRELAETGSLEELELQKQILDAQMAQELENVELSEEEKYLIRETFAQKAEELDKQYHDNLVKQAKDARKAYAEQLKSTAQSASQAFGAMSDLLSQYGEENEEAAGAAKAFGIMQIITDQAIAIADTAKAITAAVAGATAAAASTGPAAPFVLAGYIAAMVGAVIGAVASVTSTIMQAKQLMSGADKDAGKFATGGVVGGSSYTGDKLIAHVNSGEGIYTGSQANNLLQEIANNPARGGFDYGQMTEAMVAAVAAQPAPVMVYQELRDFEQKVSTFDELAKI
jgi:hypothetical protein